VRNEIVGDSADHSQPSQIKEGAEKLREVAKDRRALSDVASIVKKSNTKLAELKSELHELESQIILTQGNSNGKGESQVSSTRFREFSEI
jgi:serine/threonine-protein kinase N2